MWSDYPRKEDGARSAIYNRSAESTEMNIEVLSLKPQFLCICLISRMDENKQQRLFSCVV